MADNDPTRIMTTGVPPSGRTQGADRTVVMQPDGQSHLGVGLSLICLPGNAFARAHEAGHEHILCEIRSGAQGSAGLRMPLNVCLCLDRSGSMEGEPLEYAKRACSYVVDLLEPNDLLSIVTFADHADIVMPSRRVVNKPLIKDYINRIFVGNTTNLYDGLVSACQQVASARSASNLNRVILLTDGEPTAGTKDFRSIVGYVADQRAQGVTVTTLGFGPDYNEELVAGMARRSGGNYYYISRPELLPEVFRRELDTMMRIVARGLSLKLTFPRGVSVRQVYGKEVHKIGARVAEVSLVDLERDGAVTSLWDLELTPHPAGVFRAARAELTYDDLATGKPGRVQADALIEFTKDSQKIASGVNPRVQGEVQIAMAARDLDKTMMGARTQQLDGRTVVMDLQKTRTLLLGQGKSQEAERIEQAIADIEQGGSVEKTLIGTIYNLDQGKST
jgi:Ca-activated chloride channel family protein